ncbi:MAG: AMP-binding protein [Nitrospirae bacterium]|nr:AMP-binding protein [Nitrospirota bacterium]
MNDLYQYRNIEFSTPDEIRAVQERLLQNHLAYIYENSPFYRRTLDGIALNKITLENLSSLPFTNKSAFENHNDELLAVPMSKIVDIVLSSGTTGKPTKIMYTENDLRRLAYNEEISFASCGITPDDIVLLTCTIDRCFIAGLAYFLGIRAIGAAAVRNGLNSVDSHMEIILRMKPTAIVGVPSFLHKLGLFLQSKGIDPRKTGVKKFICIGEPLRDKNLSLLKMGAYLEEIWGARVFSTYASSETITTFCDCTAQNGGHLHPELAIAEIVNDNGEVLPPGEVGEVVVTTFFIEGMPLLRFRTGDVSFLIDGPCECGRKSPRLGPILGRKKQMMKYKGTTLYPQAVYSALDEIPEVAEYYVSVTSDFDLSDALKVYVSVNGNSCTEKEIMDILQARLRVRPDVIISSGEEIRKQLFAGNSRKAMRFIDRRTDQ